jgi:hypothetical protein
MKARLRWGRTATYTALAAMALALGAVAPAQAAVSSQVSGNSTLRIGATAKTNDTTFAVNQRLDARATMTYTAEVLGLPLPLTAAYVNSMPVSFGRPQLVESGNADLTSLTFSQKRDPWLGTDQWMIGGDKGFWGSLTVSIKGTALAKTKSSKYFHAGTGTGHALDANSALRIVVT